MWRREMWLTKLFVWTGHHKQMQSSDYVFNVCTHYYDCVFPILFLPFWWVILILIRLVVMAMSTRKRLSYPPNRETAKERGVCCAGKAFHVSRSKSE
jgi:hypothetical protein